MELNFNELVEGLQGEILIEGKNKEFNTLSTDTRKLEKNNIFLALKGENFNGNEYVEQAFLKGASIVVIDEVLFDVDKFKDKGTVIKVKNGNEVEFF